MLRLRTEGAGRCCRSTLRQRVPERLTRRYSPVFAGCAAAHGCVIGCTIFKPLCIGHDRLGIDAGGHASPAPAGPASVPRHAARGAGRDSIAGGGRLHGQLSHISCARPNEYSRSVLLDGMGNPPDRSADKEQTQSRAWWQPEQDGDQPQSKIDVRMTANQIRDLIADIEHFLTLPPVARSLYRLQEVLRSRVAVRIQRMTKAGDTLAALQPLCDRAANVAAAHNLAQQHLNPARLATMQRS